MRTIRGFFYTVKQHERGIVEFFGQYRRFVSPGLHFQIPLVELTRIRDVREHTMDIEPQPVITKDNVEIQVDGLIWVRPGLEADDIQRTFYSIDNWKIAVLQLAKTNLRQEFGEQTLDESLIARERISSNLRDVLFPRVVVRETPAAEESEADARPGRRVDLFALERVEEVRPLVGGGPNTRHPRRGHVGAESFDADERVELVVVDRVIRGLPVEVVLLGRRHARMGIGRSDHAELVRVGAHRGFELEASTEGGAREVAGTN